MTNQLTKHFKRSEFTCKCGCGYDHIYLPFVQKLELIRVLANSMYAFQTHGCHYLKGIYAQINSGCRCWANNEHQWSLGFKPSQRSTHLPLYQGNRDKPWIDSGGSAPDEYLSYACDIRLYGYNAAGSKIYLGPQKILACVRHTDMWKGGVIVYRNRLHLDYRHAFGYNTYHASMVKGKKFNEFLLAA